MNKEELLEKLKSNDKNEVRMAIKELENFEEEDVIKSIVNTILNSKSKIIVEAGVEALLTFKNKEMVSKYAIDLIFSESPKIRHAGIEILSLCGDKAIKVIEEKLLNNKDFNVRKHALDILKDIKTEKALDLVVKLLNDENPNVKYSAFEFLMNFTKLKEKVIKIIFDFIKNEKFDNLYGATTVASTIIYGHYFDKRFIPILREKLKNIKDDLVKHWIYKILIYLGDKDIISEAKENAKKVDMLNVIENDIEMAKNNSN